jgi:rhomboid protease GluP
VNKRFPWLTLAVFAATSGVTAAMYVWPWIGAALERDPAMLHGEWWRFVTAWLVLTDGWVQVVINSLALLIFGILAERAIGRLWWIVAYVVAGLTGEVAGILWQPVGGGNSVAICGLIGLFSVWRATEPQASGQPRVINAVVWGGLGLWLVTQSDIHGAALIAGFAVGVVAFMFDGRRARRSAL